MEIIFTNKWYTHFDAKKHYKKYERLVRDTQWVTKHGFFPFIHFKMHFVKYTEDDSGSKSKKSKERDVYYSAHVDRFIYQYYAKYLNKKYNLYAKQHGINRVSIAYRDIFRGKSNIHFAKDVFEFIVRTQSSYVFVGDLTSFFDKLNHNYLKDKIKQLLDIDRLDEANYAIFKSVTKFSYVDLNCIKTFLGEKFKESKNLQKYFNTAEFHEIKKIYLKKYKSDFGIPQGSSISAVYSNIYMIDFDEKMNSYVTGINGMYRRYCDDIVIVIPVQRINDNVVEAIKKRIYNIINSIPNLEINDSKTSSYYYKDNTVFPIGNSGNRINYLGFSFDGTSVRIREKSVFKYYCRAYRKIRSINRISNKKFFIAGKKNIYKLYTHLGARVNKCNRGNFLTYAYKADNIFSESEMLNSYIRNQVKKHWSRITHRLRSDDN